MAMGGFFGHGIQEEGREVCRAENLDVDPDVEALVRD
jgi:hypothetical protein